MIYLAWYLGIGAVFLVVIFISHRLSRPREAEAFADLIDAMDPRSKRWWWKPLNNVVVPILAALLVLLVWPITIYWKTKELIDARRRKEELPAQELRREFAVARDHLRSRYALAEIEAHEVVLDPLGAAPRIPFGHLNPAWETFKQSLGEDDELWSFSAPWTPEWGRDEVREGYVALHEGVIGPHFLTRRTLIDG